MKKTLSMLVICFMTFSMINVSINDIYATDYEDLPYNELYFEEGDYQYHLLEDGTYELSHYYGDSDVVTTPTSIKGKPITTIGAYAFVDDYNLKSITISEGITSIDKSAFYGSSNLTNVTLPATITNIGEGAFKDCSSLGGITLPEGVINIGDEAFSGCTSLTDIVIPNSVETIGENGFWYCENLTDITLSQNLKAIENLTFEGCIKLENITIPNSVTKIGDGAFEDCASLKKITIPGSVKTVGDRSFEYCIELEDLILSNGITRIEEGAFEGCENIKSIKIPDSVTYIGPGAFSGCERLEELTIYDSVTSIGEDAFMYDFSLKKIYLYKDSCADYYTYPCGTKIYMGANGCKHPDIIQSVVKKATLSAKGSIQDKCAICGMEMGSPKAVAAVKTVKLSATTYTYDGKAKTPTVTVKDTAGKTLTKNTDYTLTYASGRKNVGKYKVTVKGKGKYSFTESLYFTINPVKTSISSLTAGTKAFTVKWAKKTTQTTGYEIQYSTSSSFTTGTATKTVTVTSNTTTSKTIKSLTAKKKYYVRVRTYKSVSGTKYYSAWCTKKYVTTK